MPRGTRHILTGTLCRTRLGYALAIDDGGIWRLDIGAMWRSKRFIGQRVIVEGVRAGFDLLDVQRLEVLSAPNIPPSP